MTGVSPPRTPAPPDALLVIRLGAIGDVIRTLPAVSCLKRSFSGTRISWAVEEPSREILEGHPDVDEVLVLKRKLFRGFAIGAALRHLREFRAGLRDRRFGWVVDLHGTLKSALIARAAGAERIFGFGPGHAREKAHFLYTDPIPLPRRRMSRVDRALAVASALGADTGSPRRILPIHPGAARAMAAFLDSEAPARPLVFVYPGTSASQAFKRYPAARLAEICAELSASTGGTILVGWGPGEREIAEEVVARSRGRCVLAPPTRLRELGELIRASDLFIGSDTGPLHLAAATGVPVVALYGPTDPEINAPYTDRPHAAFKADVSCSPCRNKGCRNRACLELIDTSAVARRAAELLAAGAGA